MPISIGSVQIAGAYLGSKPLKAICVGATQVWPQKRSVAYYVMADRNIIHIAGDDSLVATQSNLSWVFSAPVESNIAVWVDSAYSTLYPPVGEVAEPSKVDTTYIFTEL